MIIVRLTGGLGNQMFQYALGRALAEKESTILKIDLSGYRAYKLHRYSLHCFHIWDYIATQTETAALEGPPPHRLTYHAQRLLNKIGVNEPIRPKSTTPYLLIERDFTFDPSVLQRKAPLLIQGYWQSEKYFIDIADIIHREFDVKYRQDAESRRIADLIRSVDAISLHVRRTDYVQDPRINQIHGICNQDYYDRAIQRLQTSVKNPHFFIFSDDPEWVKAEMKLDHPTTIVAHNGPSRNYEDLRLMSLCQHNIIANSSFSWWGAWLNENPQKMVIAPSRWFADENRDSQAKDIVPESWIKL